MNEPAFDATNCSSPPLVRWGTYPLLWLWTGSCIGYGLTHPDELQAVLSVKATVMVLALLLLEWRFPLQRRWRMTWHHLLRRDLVFIAVNGATFALLGYGLVALGIEVSEASEGPMSGRPLWLQVIAALIVFEALQYSIHRFMHRSRGPLSHFLWRTHAIHHLPQQLYVVMHAVFHPFNAVIVRICVQLLPIWLLGYDPEAVFAYGSVIALHGTVSHLNLDLRMGWANYVFIGPELHRFHHSANDHEAMNFGATLACFDLLFGTFLYRPGTPPAELGLRQEDGYPGQHQPWRAALFPLRVAPVVPTRA